MSELLSNPDGNDGLIVQVKRKRRERERVWHCWNVTWRLPFRDALAVPYLSLRYHLLNPFHRLVLNKKNMACIKNYLYLCKHVRRIRDLTISFNSLRKRNG